MDLARYIRDVPDFPKPGILFKDITPLLGDPTAFSVAIDRFAERYSGEPIDVIASIEARGFLFAAPLASRLCKTLVPIRKPGKLPWDTQSLTYSLEYGEDTIEMHSDAIRPGQRVLIVDDVLATGGTVSAAVRLAERAGAEIAGLAFLIELEDLRGRDRLRGYNLFSQLVL